MCAAHRVVQNQRLLRPGECLSHVYFAFRFLRAKHEGCFVEWRAKSEQKLRAVGNPISTGWCLLAPAVHVRIALDRIIESVVRQHGAKRVAYYKHLII